MLHNSTREQLLQINQGSIALVIDACYFSGMQEYQIFTLGELVQRLKPLQTPFKIIRIALLSPIFKRQGSRLATYTLPAPSTVRKAFKVESDVSTRDELGEEAFASLKAYRMALHHALIVRRPRRYLRALLAARLAVCKTTTRNYDRALGHQVTATYKFIPFDDDTWAELSEGRLKPHKYFLLVKHQGKEFFAPLRYAIAQHWALKGASVWLIQQMGNVYTTESLGASYAGGEYADFILT